jgi:hypothetical protein
MTPSMEDYAALAEKIGMWLEPHGTWWSPWSTGCAADLLPAYLAEPAQMSRILRADLPGDGWEMYGPIIGAGWRVIRRREVDAIGSALADTPEEAVRDAGALALRAKRNG